MVDMTVDAHQYEAQNSLLRTQISDGRPSLVMAERSQARPFRSCCHGKAINAPVPAKGLFVAADTASLESMALSPGGILKADFLIHHVAIVAPLSLSSCRGESHALPRLSSFVYPPSTRGLSVRQAGHLHECDPTIASEQTFGAHI